MTLPDSEAADRWTTQVKAWRQLAAGLQQFSETLDLQLIGYDRTARIMPTAGVAGLDDVRPGGDLTDLSEAAAYSLQAAGANPLAGVVFIGDGRTHGPAGGKEPRRPRGPRCVHRSNAWCAAHRGDLEFDGRAVLGDSDWTGRRRLGNSRRGCRRIGREFSVVCGQRIRRLISTPGPWTGRCRSPRAVDVDRRRRKTHRRGRPIRSSRKNRTN